MNEIFKISVCVFPSPHPEALCVRGLVLAPIRLGVIHERDVRSVFQWPVKKQQTQ